MKNCEFLLFLRVNHYCWEIPELSMAWKILNEDQT